MRPLNFDLAMMTRRNEDGAHATQAGRTLGLQMIADELNEMLVGKKLQSAKNLKPKHVHMLVAKWKKDRISDATIRNRLGWIRWWAENIGKRYMLPTDNAAFGLAVRQRFKGNKAKELTPEMLAKVSALGTRRSMEYGTAKTPVHVYVDEADLFVSPAMLVILSKLRQHGIYMTFAQQTPAFGYTGSEREQLLNNTSIKFASGDGQGAMLKMMNVPADATRSLRQQQFIGRWGRGGTPFKITVHDTIANRPPMSGNEWQNVLQHQISTYYAAIEDQTAMAALPAPSAIAENAKPNKQTLSPSETMLRKPDESEWPD